jgi:hypothetical protein
VKWINRVAVDFIFRIGGPPGFRRAAYAKTVLDFRSIGALRKRDRLELNENDPTRYYQRGRVFNPDTCLEDAENIAAAERLYREYLADPSNAIPFSVIRAELGL